MHTGTSNLGKCVFCANLKYSLTNLCRNVMIADDGRPILMDFGSAMKARIKIENRSQALLQQDIAAEQSTMAYRAPELFDVKTGVIIDEKVDIWVRTCIYFRSVLLMSSISLLAVHYSRLLTRTRLSRTFRRLNRVVQ